MRTSTAFIRPISGSRRNFTIGSSSNRTRSVPAGGQRRIIMMQSRELQQRFSHIEQTIHQAAQACEKATGVPMDVKDSIQQMDQQTGQARQTMQSQDESRIMECVDNLEQLGDRAKNACERAGQVDETLRNAVMQAHRELSELKHQLH